MFKYFKPPSLEVDGGFYLYSSEGTEPSQVQDFVPTLTSRRPRLRALASASR